MRKLFAGEGGRIETQSPGYVLKLRPEELDSHRFQAMVESGEVERLRSALGLWSGDPLADFAYEEWAQPHIRRLRGLWARAVEMLAEAELEDGRIAAVPELLDSLIAADPLREGPRRLLMLALYRGGRQAEALRTYRDFRKLLIEEMGVEPSSDLVQLEEQILLQDPAVGSSDGRRAPSAKRHCATPTKGWGPSMRSTRAISLGATSWFPKWSTPCRVAADCWCWSGRRGAVSRAQSGPA